MRTARTKNQRLKILGIGLLAAALAGCGAPPQSIPAQIGSQALAMTPEQFAWQCQSSGNTLISINGVSVCRGKVYAASTLATIPLVQLTPGQAQGGQSIGILPAVRKNDLVTLQAQGDYGTDCFITCSGTIYSMDGVSRNAVTGVVGGTVVLNGQPAGLMVSDGTATYFAGSGSQIRIGNDGMLRFGLNSAVGSAPKTSLTNTPLITRVTIERCIDINSQTHVCP